MEQAPAASLHALTHVRTHTRIYARAFLYLVLLFDHCTCRDVIEQYQARVQVLGDLSLLSPALRKLCAELMIKSQHQQR